MLVIYSATPENTRRGQFEIFWYSHHCFVLFFILILFHGNGGINPHYWMYAMSVDGMDQAGVRMRA